MIKYGKTYYNYCLVGSTEVKSVYAKDATSARWQIIERHGAGVKLRYIEYGGREFT